MIILIKLILAHFIGDFILQPKSWVTDKENKEIKSIKLYLHILIHGVLVLILFWSLNFWFLALVISITHGIIDIIKLYAQTNKHKSTWFFIDQILHLISILILWSIFFDRDINLNFVFKTPSFWIYTLAFIFLSSVSGIIIRIVLSNWTIKINEPKEVSLKNAGQYIGILERLFVFVFVITRNWEDIGFLLASKSVFRFGDLKDAKDRKLTEYILVGTLLSFGIAVVTGMAALKLIKVIGN
ncbi:MAG TPA: DUF3307 domain-containing protein [Flavobacteriales bacterium]|nr:DUF3307 domain-containing protein [Flavobacteriales bacterium]